MRTWSRSSPPRTATANRVIVLGKDTDAAFYGLTTVYQILQQDADSSLRALVASDHADVITRGFIEGYYGNPWSTRDRVALMEWGGYYKLNAYFYAPKDDPKHNAQWREKYTQSEIDEKIKPLAEAGNKSKVRFVYALHPFMTAPSHTDNYDETVRDHEGRSSFRSLMRGPPDRNPRRRCRVSARSQRERG